MRQPAGRTPSVLASPLLCSLVHTHAHATAADRCWGCLAAPDAQTAARPGCEYTPAPGPSMQSRGWAEPMQAAWPQPRAQPGMSGQPPGGWGGGHHLKHGQRLCQRGGRPQVVREQALLPHQQPDQHDGADVLRPGARSGARQRTARREVKAPDHARACWQCTAAALLGASQRSLQGAGRLWRLRSRLRCTPGRPRWPGPRRRRPSRRGT